MEASRSLGMSYGKTMRKVILPQAFRRMLPPLGNNAIAIVKDSSLASAVSWLTAYAARADVRCLCDAMEPYLTISLVYWVITFLLSLLVRHMERGSVKVIHVHNLQKQFGETHVLRSISCEIQPKEVVCIIGPSGSGKSTFLRCINALNVIQDNR